MSYLTVPPSERSVRRSPHSAQAVKSQVCDLFAGGAPSARRELITRLPDHLPILVQACQPLWLVVNYGVYRSFTSIHHTLPSWFPSALRLAESDFFSRFSLLTVRSRATLSRTLRTPTSFRRRMRARTYYESYIFFKNLRV